jgi:formate dehydrogenase subunit delta
MNTDETSDAAPHVVGHGSGPEQLVKMANDIGHFFRAEPEREDAIAHIANHIDKFWTRRMREKLRVHVEGGGDPELDQLPREAVQRLIQHRASAPVTPATVA